MKQALIGEDLTVYGDGSQTRCFTHVSDAVDALIALADHPEANGEIYNIGSVEEISILNLAQRIKEMVASVSNVVMIPYERAYDHGFEDMMRRVPSVDKLHAITGFRPQTSLNEIIDRVAAFFRDRANAGTGVATGSASPSVPQRAATSSAI